MERRSFIALLSGAASWPLAARAQQKSMPVVGGLFAASPPANLDDLVHGPIHQGMGELGFVEGQNMAWEYRWAEGHYERLPALAADLVSRKVDVIVTYAAAFPRERPKLHPRRSRSSPPSSPTQSRAA